MGADGAMDRTTHLSYGDVPGRDYVFEVFTDLTIHGWDLARGIGADEQIDPDKSMGQVQPGKRVRPGAAVEHSSH